MKEKFSDRLRAQAANRLKLPRELVYSEAIVTLTGMQGLVLENYRGIRFYTGEELVVQTQNGRIRVQGRNLIIDSYTREEVRVSGQILAVLCDEQKGQTKSIRRGGVR